MHPLLADRKRLILYLGTWLVIGSLIEVPFILSCREQMIPMILADIPFDLFYSLVCLSSYYLCKVFPLDSTPWYQLVIFFSSASAIASGLSMAAGSVWIRFIDSLMLAAPIAPYYKPLMGIWSILLLLFLLITMVHYMFIAYEQAREAERTSYELKLFAQDAELRALRAQINPHFLFNSLHSISALIGSNQAQARTMTLKLADFFRRGLKLGTEDFIPFRDELSLISDFLEIEKIRFGTRLNVDQQIDSGTTDAAVPPLILQPIVENAVRHGIAQMVDGGTIRIAAVRTGDRIKLTVENPVDPDRPRRKGTGLGLRNVRSRLTTLYGGDARIDVEETKSYFRVELIFPVRTPEH